MERRVIDGYHEEILARLDHSCGIYGALSSGGWRVTASLWFFFKGSKPPESKTRRNGSKQPPGTQKHKKKRNANIR